MNPRSAIVSPCKRLCHMVGGGCPACGRSMVEIQQWQLYTPARREEIMSRSLQARMGLRSVDIPEPAGGSRLGPEQREAVLKHFMALSPTDRHARFGHGMSDEALSRWVDALDWGGQWLWGVFEEDNLIGLAHLVPPLSDHRWEMALSVVPVRQGQGMAKQLIHAGLSVAQALAPGGVLMMRGDAQNEALQRLAREGETCVHDGELQVQFWL